MEEIKFQGIRFKKDWVLGQKIEKFGSFWAENCRKNGVSGPKIDKFSTKKSFGARNRKNSVVEPIFGWN